MTDKKTFTIYEREYDNPLNADGTKKPNELLGEVEIVCTLSGGSPHDGYRGEWIVEKEGEIYMLDKVEVSFVNGGSRFGLTKLDGICRKVEAEVPTPEYEYPWPDWVKKGTKIFKGEDDWYAQGDDIFSFKEIASICKLELPYPRTDLPEGTIFIKE